MVVASLHRFLPGRIVAIAAWYAFLASLVVVALLAFGATGAAGANWVEAPFRW